MPQEKKTKIVATLGPASSSKEVIEKMILAGVNVFRINFSHANHNDVKDTINLIRELNSTYNYNAAILADLQGPKIRIGAVKVDYAVKKGDIILFKTGDPFIAVKNEFYMSYSNFANDVKVGEKILIDEMPIIPIYTYVRQYQLSSDVKGWYPNLLDSHHPTFIYLER